MGRLGSRPRWLAAAGVIGLVSLAGLGWVAVSQGLRILAQNTLSRLLDTPVHIASARPGWPPVRIVLSDVRVGESEAPELSFSAIRVDVEALPLLHREVRGLRLDLGETRTRPADDGGPPSLAKWLGRLAQLPLGESGLHIDSVHVDELRIDGERTFTSRPFDLGDIDISRAASGPVRATGAVRAADVAAGFTVEVGSRDGVSTLRLDADVSAAKLDAIGSGPPWNVVGEARGVLSYQSVGEPAGAAPRIRATGSVSGLGIDTAQGRVVSISELEVTDLVLEPGLRRASAAAVVATDVGVAPSFLALFGTDPGSSGWETQVTRATITDLRFGTPAAPTIDAAALRDVDTAEGTGTIQLEAHLAGGRIVLVAARTAAEAPGGAELRVDALPLAALADASPSALHVVSGLLDLRVTLTGTPGIEGLGEASVRDLAVTLDTPNGAEPAREVLALADMHVASGYFSVFPPRLQLRSAQLIEPEISIRTGERGLEIEPLFTGGLPVPDPAPWLRATAVRLARWFGDATAPAPAPSPVGVRVSDGTILFSDERTTPPFSITLSRVNALLQGPAGPAGPIQAETEASGGPVGTVRLRGRTGPEDVTASGEIGPADLPALDPYLGKWLGVDATSGRMDLSFNARLEPDPAANVRIGLDGVRLTGDAEHDRLGHYLGLPLTEIVARVQGEAGRGRLDLSLTGSRSAPGYGLLDALPEALRQAVAEPTRP